MFRKKPHHPKLIIVAFVVLLLTLPFFLLSMNQRQDTRQQAATNSCPTTFTDVPANSPLTTQLACFNTYGDSCIVIGELDGTFAPNRALTWGEFMAFITRFHLYILHDWDIHTPQDTNPNAQPSFKDVPLSYPFYKEIETAHYYKWANGDGSGYAKPDDPWRFGFHGFYRAGSTDKYGVTHSGTGAECWNNICYVFTPGATITREAMVLSMFSYGQSIGALPAVCPVPTNTPTPTNTPFPTKTPTPTPLPRPTNTPVPTLATSPTPGCVVTDLGCIPEDPIGFAEKLYGLGMGILGGIALLSIMYGGYQISTSRGDPSRIANGKKYIFYALGALALGAFGLVLFDFIATNTFHIPGFS